MCPSVAITRFTSVERAFRGSRKVTTDPWLGICPCRVMRSPTSRSPGWMAGAIDEVGTRYDPSTSALAAVPSAAPSAMAAMSPRSRSMLAGTSLSQLGPATSVAQGLEMCCWRT